MKKFRSLLLALLLGAALTACGGANTTTPNADSPLAGDETPQPVDPVLGDDQGGDLDTPGTDGVNEGDNDVIGDSEDDGIDGIENNDGSGSATDLTPVPTVAP